MADVLYISEDSKITVTGLHYVTDAGVTTYLNAATITYTLQNAVGTTVVGGTGTLAFIAASNGNYTAVIDKTVTVLLSDGQKYYLVVPIAESGRDGYRRLELRAEYRGAT